MARQVGNQNMPNPRYRDATLPSTHDRDQLEFTDSFPANAATHKHRTPRGERSQAELRAYEAAGNRELKRSGQRTQPFTERTRHYLANHETNYSPTDGGDLYSGKLSKGQRYADETMSKSWDPKTGKSRGAQFEPGNAGRKGHSHHG
jgi:hypothetical protein